MGISCWKYGNEAIGSYIARKMNIEYYVPRYLYIIQNGGCFSKADFFKWFSGFFASGMHHLGSKHYADLPNPPSPLMC